MTQASVVIASRRSGLITKAIASVLQDPATLEVVVVAVEAPEVAAAAAGVGDPRVSVLPAPAGNPNTARHVGVEHARGEIVVMLDDDVLARPGLVGGHVRHHQGDGLVVFGYMPIPSHCLRGILRFPARLYARNYEDRVGWWTEHPELVITGFWGGNVSMTRADVLRIGLENPAFPIRYFEDREFGSRCHAAGLVARFDRRLEATHIYRRAISEWLIEGRRVGAALKLLYPDREPGAGCLPPMLRPALLAATIAAGTLRFGRAEDRLARAARQIEVFRGGQEVVAGTAIESGLLVGAPGPNAMPGLAAEPGSDRARRTSGGARPHTS